MQVEKYFQALLSPDMLDRHLDPKDDVSKNFDENAALVTNRSMLIEIFLDKTKYKGTIVQLNIF
jgi:hypothetical protein